MKKPVVIAAAILLVILLTAAGILLVNKKNSTPGTTEAMPNVRIMEAAPATDHADDEMLSQLAELRTQVERLEREKGQAEFEKAALQSEQDKLKKRLADLEEQNQYLRDRSSAISDMEQGLHNDIAERNAVIAHLNANLARLEKERSAAEGTYQNAMERVSQLNETMAQLETERNAKDIAYQKALAQASEYRESLERRDRALTQAESPGQIHVNRSGELVDTFKILPPGQSRNILGVKFGDRDFNLEGTIALIPHWFAAVTLGIDQTHDDFVKEEFPGYDADNAFFYDVLFGTGLNWRFNKIQSQPNFYISTAVGPAWFLYKYEGETDMKTYLLWRSSVGFDLTLHKHLQFTGDIGVDWVQDYGFSPRFSLGVLWSFSHDWSIFREKGK